MRYSHRVGESEIKKNMQDVKQGRNSNAARHVYRHVSSRNASDRDVFRPTFTSPFTPFLSPSFPPFPWFCRGAFFLNLTLACTRDEKSSLASLHTVISERLWSRQKCPRKNDKKLLGSCSCYDFFVVFVV